jgi:hypothetical protein
VIVDIITYERSTSMNTEKYIGLDVHQATISVAVLDSMGKVAMESIWERKQPPFSSSLLDCGSTSTLPSGVCRCYSPHFL